MEGRPVLADVIEHGRYVAHSLTSLPSEESHSQSIHAIVGGGTTTVVNISILNDHLQVQFTYTEASTLLAHIHAHKEERIVREYQDMNVTTTEHPHIIRGPLIGGSEPIIVGTGVRVRILVEYWRGGTPPEELLQAFPHLTLAQVFDALSYYQDHQAEINALIEQNRVDPARLHESARRCS
jgi:uncharacterized protein (DUF433 family)